MHSNVRESPTLWQLLAQDFSDAFREGWNLFWSPLAGFTTSAKAKLDRAASDHTRSTPAANATLDATEFKGDFEAPAFLRSTEGKQSQSQSEGGEAPDREATMRADGLRQQYDDLLKVVSELNSVASQKVTLIKKQPDLFESPNRGVQGTLHGYDRFLLQGSQSIGQVVGGIVGDDGMVGYKIQKPKVHMYTSGMYTSGMNSSGASKEAFDVDVLVSTIESSTSLLQKLLELQKTLLERGLEAEAKQTRTG